MTFQDDLRRHRANRDRRIRDFKRGATELVQESITNGSPVTGAPGQPVQTGFLRGSWSPRWVSEDLWRTTTDAPYAPFIEEGNYTQRSAVGGPHSVKLTRSGWPRIVDHVARELGPP